MSAEAPTAYQEGANFHLPIIPAVSPDHGDLSADSATRRTQARTRGRAIAGAATIGGILIGGGALAQVEQPGGVTDPACTTPSESPASTFILESPMPSESFFSSNPDGSIDVFVPESPAPFSPLPSTEPGQALIGDPVTGPEGSADPKASEDPETAAKDLCEPDGRPLPTPSPSPSPSGNSWAEYLATGPDQFEVLEDIMTQDNSEIRTNITQPRLKRIISRFWKNHSRELNANQYVKPGDPHQFYSKKFVDRLLGYVGEKLVSHNDWPRYNAAQLVYILGRIAGDHTYSLELREDAAIKVDDAYDAEVGQMPADQREQGRADINRKIRGANDFQLHPR